MFIYYTYDEIFKPLTIYAQQKRSYKIFKYSNTEIQYLHNNNTN